MELINNLSLDKIVNIVPFILPIIIIILSLNKDNLDKLYQKQYILLMYFIGTSINIYLLLYRNITFVFILKYLFISFFAFIILSFFSGINLIYEADNFTKRLSTFKLLILKTSEWIITTRTYLIYIVILTNFLIFSLLKYFNIKYNLELKDSTFLIGILMFIVIFSFYNLILNAKDLFGTFGFADTKLNFEVQIKKFNEIYIEEDTIKNEHVIDLLGFLVYMEDKDFFERIKFTLDINQIFKRKNKLYNSNEDGETITKKWLIIKFVSDVFTIKNFKRGHSTLPQQLIRRISLKPDSYTRKTKFRRKIFVENIYMPYFFDTYIFFKKITVGKNNNLSNYNKSITKIDILKAYWVEVLNCPEDEDSLFKSMATQSALKYETYHEYYYKKFLPKKSKYSKIIKKDIYKKSITI